MNVVFGVGLKFFVSMEETVTAEIPVNITNERSRNAKTQIAV
jgi:hypothetical protein